MGFSDRLATFFDASAAVKVDPFYPTMDNKGTPHLFQRVPQDRF